VALLEFRAEKLKETISPSTPSCGVIFTRISQSAMREVLQRVSIAATLRAGRLRFLLLVVTDNTIAPRVLPRCSIVNTFEYWQEARLSVRLDHTNSLFFNPIGGYVANR
jgi:hypothetical protein